jgi:hypothetical protein
MVYTMIYIMMFIMVYTMTYVHVYALLIYTVISGARSHDLWRNTGICHWAKMQRQTCAKYSGKHVLDIPNDTRQCCCRAIGFCLVMMLMLQSGSHTCIASHPAQQFWKQGWRYCRFQCGDKQLKQALWAQPLDVVLWEGAALHGQAEQRRRERLTEARKSTPDDEAATRRVLHQGGCWGQGCSGRWMKKRCYGIYHGIYVYIYIYIIKYTNDLYCGMSCMTYGI